MTEQQIPLSEDMVEVPLKPGYNRKEALPFLKFFNRPNTYEFLLEWTLPVTKAWIVMVDECILRIDFTLEGQGSFTHNCCFPLGSYKAPFLKCKVWDAKDTFIGGNSRAYRFTIQP